MFFLHTKKQKNTGRGLTIFTSLTSRHKIFECGTLCIDFYFEIKTSYVFYTKILKWNDYFDSSAYVFKSNDI